MRRVILQEFEKDRKIDIKRKERKKKGRKNRQIDRQSQDYALYTARQTWREGKVKERKKKEKRK